MLWKMTSLDCRARRDRRNRRRDAGRAICLEQLEDRLAPATLPPGFTESVIASNLAEPTAMEIAPDGRIFVTEQGGRLRVIENDILRSQSFVNLNVNSAGERGLLGIAFDPNFATNHFVYAYYTTSSSPVHNRVSRFTANGNVAIPGSEQVIIDLNNLSGATNHNGGAIHFGSDGMLYVAVGENANPPNSQTLNNLLGKVLRINANGSIPNDNPFFNTASGINRAIWALGLRNPFTFAVQPGTGRIFINDVGQNKFEEINDGIAGSNYGWPDSEGLRQPGDPAVSIGTYRDPLFNYDHDIGPTGGCAIAGGAFYNPITDQFPAGYVGEYFFADLCSAWIRRLDPVTHDVTDFASNLPAAPVDLKVDAAGNLYYLTRGSGSNTGQVTRVQFAQTAPQITQQPVDRRVAAGQPVTFTASAIGATPLSFQWQRNGVNIPGATSPTLTLATTSLLDNGAAFHVVVTNSLGTATSNDATLTVVDNELPVAQITSPNVGTLYNAGDTIHFAGTGTDREDGTLAPSAFTWEIVFHHADHVHPFIQPFSGVTSGSFVIPTQGETATNVFFRIHLTVTDSFGFSNSTFRDVLPRTSVITLATNPGGIGATLDGIPTGTPTSLSSVVGMTRSIGVASSTLLGGVHYEFLNWSDGGAIQHNITTPASDMTFTANFQAIPAPRVTDLRVVKGSKRLRRVVISFDKPLDADSAMDARNYRIVAAGLDGRFDTQARPSNDDVSIAFDPPQYDSATNRLTLNVPRGISSNEFFQVTVDGTRGSAGDPALLGINGDLLDGELVGSFPSGNGTPGGDFVALFGMGDSFSYIDASGDSVGLDLKRQGDLEVIREAPVADGIRSEGLAFHLTQTNRRSRLSGHVKGSGSTTFDRVTGLIGVDNNVQNNPSFILTQISAVVVDRILEASW